MKNKRLHLTLTTLAIGLTTAHCSVITAIDDECTRSSDCEGFSVCDEGLCVTQPSTGVCTVQTDCALGEACSDGQCFVLPRQSVTEEITTNTTWRNDRVYVLDGTVYVREPAVLTIQAGTQILGAPDSDAALIVDRGRLDVRGSADAPVVFSSARPVGQRQTGDWGGVAVIGNAPVNNAVVTPEGTELPTLEGVEPPLTYGGTDPTHNCGTMQYMRIEFAGFALELDGELNGLTLAGCGSTTLVDHVQVHRGLDDGVELFGGSANIRHIVISDPADDGLDWDAGWQGQGQYIVIRQDDGDSSGIEADNNGDEDAGDFLPRSSPTISNLTVVGTRDPRFPAGSSPTTGIGATLRRGTAGLIVNAIFSNQGTFPVVIDGRDSQQCALLGTEPQTGEEDCALNANEDTELQLRAALFHQTSPRPESELYPVDDDGAAPGFVHETWTSSSSVHIDIGTRDLIVDPFGQRFDDRPRFYPIETITNPAAEVPPEGEFFDGNGTFIGAIRDADTDWTAGWTAYPDN